MPTARSESHVSTGVGPQPSFVSTSPEARLPFELWQLIIANLDDHCFVWFVLRRTSHLFRLVTEDLFALYIFRTCTVRFAGEHAKKLLFLPTSLNQDLQNIWDNQRSPVPLGYPVNYEYRSAWDYRYQPPTFRFQPCAFVPVDSKAKIVLNLCDASSDPSPLQVQPYPSFFSANRLAGIFFHPGPEADSNRLRLSNEAHFVRFNNQLRSIRIPSLVIDVPGRQITLDWRELCQDFLCDELRCRLNSKSLGSWSLRL